jgi:hypothetical protein
LCCHTIPHFFGSRHWHDIIAFNIIFHVKVMTSLRILCNDNFTVHKIMSSFKSVIIHVSGKYVTLAIEPRFRD